MIDKCSFGDLQLKRIKLEEYSEDEYMVAKMDVLGTNPNSHKLIFSEEVFSRDISSILGKFVVCKVFCGDAKGHEVDETIVGQVIKDQDVEIYRNENGYLRAKVDVVLSKIYAESCCNIFSDDNNDERAVSVEMSVNKNSDNEVLEFNIFGVTILGRSIKPSSPGSNIKIIRFSEEEADKFYQQKHQADNLQKFAEERRKNTAKKYKIDKSKESISNDDWSEIDKTELRNKILEASNTTELVKSVYLLIEDGWKDAPSEKLKYPVMQFDGDKLVYNRNALSNALARAVQNNEDSVVKKVKTIYKKLDLDDTEKKEEETKMSEEQVVETEVFEEIEEVKEETVSEGEEKLEEVVEEKEEIEEKVEDQEEPDYKKMFEDEQAKCAEIQAKLDEQCDIVMKCNEELEELRKFKADIEEQKKIGIVNALLAKIKGKMSDEDYEKFAKSGSECKFEEVNIWRNTVMAAYGEAVVASFSEEKQEDNEIIKMELPKLNEKKSCWDRL